MISKRHADAFGPNHDKHHVDAMAYVYARNPVLAATSHVRSVLNRPGCAAFNLPPITPEERARLDSLMSVPWPSIAEIDARVLRYRYLALPHHKRQWISYRVARELGWNGAKVILEWEDWGREANG